MHSFVCPQTVQPHVNNTDVKLFSNLVICKSHFYYPPRPSSAGHLTFRMVSSSRSKITFDGHKSQAYAGRVTVSLSLFFFLFFILSAVNHEKMRGSMLVHIFSRIHVYSKTKCDLKCLCKVFFNFFLIFIFWHLLNIFAWHFILHINFYWCYRKYKLC